MMRRKVTNRFNFKRIITITSIGVFVGIATLSLVVFNIQTNSPKADALATASNWQAGRIIDDSIFFNSDSMSLQEIQAFLNEKVPNCDTNGTQIYSGSTTNATYAASQGWPGPNYVCLKDYYQVPRSDQNVNNLVTNVIPDGAISAAAIIKGAADAYNVSPKVLLVTLEKESLNLLKDNWPLPSQYRNPMGYGCPDTAPCDPQYEGFYNQMRNAARQFKLYKDNAASYRYKALQNNAISYQANSPSCGSSSIYVENQATAGLYNYTPYQPNQAALNNLYGYGDSCSAYGNRNFWRIFTDWFGGTRGLDYSWQLTQQQVFNDAARTVPANLSTLSPNTDYYFRVSAINNGNSTWSNTGANPVLLATTGPSNRNSIFCNNTWVTCNRPAALIQPSVAPGQTGTFEFKAKVSSTGNYRESFNLVAEGKSWFNDLGFYWQLNVVPPTYQWQPVSQDIFVDSGRTKPANIGALAQNTTYYATVRVKNTGNTTWSNVGPNPILFGTSSPNDKMSSFFTAGWANDHRSAVLKESTILPGETGTFEFALKAPSSYGTFKEYFRPVAENLTWMNDVGFYWPLTVAPPTTQWGLVSQQAYTDSSKSTAYDIGMTANNSRIYISIKIRNTGNTTWTNTGPNPVRLGTSSPQDRSSEFYDSSWASRDRPAALQEASVAPGNVGTFEFWVTTPYKQNGVVMKEYFKPVVDGIAWMNDLGMYQPFVFNSPQTAWELIDQSAYTNSSRTASVQLSSGVARNTTYYLQLHLRNSSGYTWTQSNFVLGTSGPNDRNSSFYDSATWVSTIRPARLKESSIAPGQTGTFEFALRTPNTALITNEYYNPLIEGVTWLNNNGLYWNIKVN